MKAEELTLQHLMALPHRDDAGFLNEHGMIISARSPGVRSAEI